jgi:biopolymer transport protein ExbD
MKTFSAILTLSFLVSCSEVQVFDTSFKANERYYLAGYCEPNDNSCPVKVDKYIDECFIASDYDPKMLTNITNIDWTNPQEALKTLENADLSEMNKFKDQLNGCMANKIGGNFSKNMEQGKASWMTDITVTSSTNQASFSTKKGSGLLFSIKDNGDIWLNKNKVKLKDLKSILKDHVKNNSDVYAVIIADRDSSIVDFTSVMDQLKSAGIKDVSLAATKPN